MEQQFLDPNEGETARWKLSQLRQGSSTAAEFFTKFDLLRRAAGYETGYDTYLITLLEVALNGAIIKTIIGSGIIPSSYADWRTRALTIDAGYQRLRELSSHHTSSKATETLGKQNTSTRTNKKFKKGKGRSGNFIPMPDSKPVASTSQQQGRTYTGQGEPMQIDRQRSTNVRKCKHCGKTGHPVERCWTAFPHLRTQQVRQHRADEQAVVKYKGKGSGNKTQNIRALIQDMSPEERNQAIEELAKAMDV